MDSDRADPEVEKAVETVCALGCERVAARIESLREGGSCPECPALNRRQRRLLLEELQAIMAVYERR